MASVSKNGHHIIKLKHNGLEEIIDLEPVTNILETAQQDMSSIDYFADIEKLDLNQKEYLIILLVGKLQEKIRLLDWVDKNPDKHKEYADFLRKAKEATKQYEPLIEIINEYGQIAKKMDTFVDGLSKTGDPVNYVHKV